MRVKHIMAPLAIAACSKPEDSSAPKAAAEETAEQTVARISASMTPQDFKLREIQCREALSYAKMDKDELPTDLVAKVEATPVMSFLKIVAQAHELGLTSDQINEAQRNQMPRPHAPEEVTPEYIANVEQCLAIAKVANARDGVA